ncbi:MAG: hypothetical protein ACOCUR_00805 [Nanoarchaeota archaeon]
MVMVRLDKFDKYLPELRKARPDLALESDQDIIKVLLRERITELMINQAEKENAAARI